MSTRPEADPHPGVNRLEDRGAARPDGPSARDTPPDQSVETPRRGRELPPKPAPMPAQVQQWANRLFSGARPGVGQISIPGYEILGLLGEGGMGSVYRAHHIPLNRLVALKILLPSVDPGRFQSEVQAIAHLQHPNVVQIFEIGTWEDLHYYAMELVEGGTLARRITGNPCSAQESARLVETLARAVHHAHEHGVIHRDLKPTNILMTTQGEPKIGDFGLASRLDHDASQPSNGGQVAGTPCYIAPEQLSQTPSAGPAVDVYALGVILYELLTGRPPFRATTPMDTLWQTRFCDPVPPGRLHAKLPRDLEVICLKCLAKEPSRRYHSAGELAEDLARFREGKPIKARPASHARQAVKWMIRQPVLASCLAVLTLVLVALIVQGWALSYREHQHAIDLGRQRDDAVRANVDKEETLRQLRVSQSRTLRLADALSSWIQLNRLSSEAVQDLVTVYREFVEDGVRSNDEQWVKSRARGYGHLSDLFEVQGKPTLALAQVEQAVVLLQELSAQHLDDRALRLELAYAMDRRGHSLQLNSRITSAEQSYRDSFGVLMALLEADPQRDTYLSSAGGVSHNLANLLLKHGSSNRQKEAQEYVKRAIEFQEKALHVQERPKYQALLKQHLFLAADCFRLTHDHVQLAACVSRITQGHPLSDPELTDCANYLTQCAADVRADGLLSASKRTELADQYAERAQQLRNGLTQRKTGDPVLK